MTKRSTIMQETHESVRTLIIGAIGAVTSFTLVDAATVASIVVSALTSIYLVIKIYRALKASKPLSD